MLPTIFLPEASPRAVVEVPAPPHFRAPRGRVRDVRIVWTDHDRLPLQRGYSVAQAAGLRYEDQAQKFLCGVGWSYARSPQIWFVDDSGPRYVIPDGLFVHDGICWDNHFLVLVEIKISHRPEAWWQLKRLYEPVLRRAKPGLPIYCLEVVRSFDPSMPFPCEVNHISDVRVWLKEPDSRFAVLQWKL